MVAIGFVSAKGSPGCTTATLALSHAWLDLPGQRRVLIAECDPAGGDIARGYLRGSLDTDRGIVALAVRRTPDGVAALWEQLLALDSDGRQLLLPGINDPSQGASLEVACAILRTAIPELAEQEPPLDVLVDLGRLHAQHDPRQLWGALDRLILVTRSSLAAVAAAEPAARELRSEVVGPQLSCVVVGEGQPYTAKEIATALALPLLGTLPDDPVGAAVFSGASQAGWRTSRSPLLRSARLLAERLVADVPLAGELADV